MNLDSINEIVRLRDQRSRAQRAIALMRMGASTSLTVIEDGGNVFETFDLLSSNLVRGAVAAVAFQELEVIEDRLRQLGVAMPPKDPEPEQTIEAVSKELYATRRDLDMYRNAWLRELGGTLVRKRHLIDALCLTTAEMRSKAEQFSTKPTVTTDDHDRRVTELLKFNNELEQRARDAERKLKKFMNGTPAERLAFAVEQAAASTIAAIQQEDSAT
jgi:hypothetical protein